MHAVKTYCNGEAARGRRKPAATKPFRRNQYTQRVRKSDGLQSKVLHVYRPRHSTTQAQLNEIFGRYGEVEEIITYRSQFALVAFRWVQDAVDAKRDLDLYETMRGGS